MQKAWDFYKIPVGFGQELPEEFLFLVPQDFDFHTADSVIGMIWIKCYHIKFMNIIQVLNLYK